MDFKIEHKPEFAWLSIAIPAGKKLFVEAASMATMSTNIRMRALFKGGFRRFLTGESLFISEFTADRVEGEVCVAPGPSGDIGHFALNGQTIFLSSTSYLAHTEGVTYETKFQKLSQGILSGTGWFLVKMTGVGDVWFNSYGSLVEMDVTESPLTIDNGHIVAFTEGVEYDIVPMGGYKSLFFSGEGFVCRFRGHGKVYMQTKKPAALIAWADRFRIVRKSQRSD
jgi:uncharacterized protein (TIGR00266 family)